MFVGELHGGVGGLHGLLSRAQVGPRQQVELLGGALNVGHGSHPTTFTTPCQGQTKGNLSQSLGDATS